MQASRELRTLFLVQPSTYTVDTTSGAIDLANWEGVKINCLFGLNISIGASTVKLQSSDDGTTWTDVDGSEFAITNTTTFPYVVRQTELGARYVRTYFDRDSGATIVGGALAELYGPTNDQPAVSGIETAPVLTLE